ncbi:MAG: helicase-related protein [Candidatus Sericytochromatia bacterium]
MPRIFDNIDEKLLDSLQDTLKVFNRADFCIGYFNLRGWKHLETYINNWNGSDENCCRLLIGMHRTPQDELKKAMSLSENEIDLQSVIRIKKKLAEEFKEQLMIGIPSNSDEKALRKLAYQLKEKKVRVKLFLRNPLHAKLYLFFRNDKVNPITGYLGSSNLTFSGLLGQGELNIDVLDLDACIKLSNWFEDRWNDKFCFDISNELIEVIEESWAREELIPPYYIYVKIAYHLSEEARAGLSEFTIPREFGNKLFDFQKAAVKIAARHVNKRGGVIIGDVVGLGKTLMATALAKIFEVDYDFETLIICPKNLEKMWDDYCYQYKLRAKILPITKVKDLIDLKRYRLVLIDESHNLRNKEGKRYKLIQEYIEKNDSKCILLSATPYNKTYLDLSNQLRLFVEENRNLGIRPEKLLNDIGELEFSRKYQCMPNTITAFEKSENPDDWRELMRLFLVRRTRTFIQENYTKTNPETKRKYLTLEDGSHSYFPDRVPKTVIFQSSDNTQYSKLYSSEIVDIINNLSLPRYGLGNYINLLPQITPSKSEIDQLKNLSRSGKRLMGFCRTNLFKRLESSGNAFIKSIERHILRNYVFINAIEQGFDIPIGTQESELLDYENNDEDRELVSNLTDLSEDISIENEIEESINENYSLLKIKAKDIYNKYSSKFKKRFKWIRQDLFSSSLLKDLYSDVNSLLKVLDIAGNWDSKNDHKINSLYNLVNKTHKKDKILVFTQFADTARYIEKELKNLGVSNIDCVTGNSNDPTESVWKFSPISNNKEKEIKSENRVLIATDVLSEGQNLQDCFIIINYDLPWAIIRLIQRAGRVDRIGQKAEKIYCYSFLPDEGVEKIIGLRKRVTLRLKENAEVVGTDEAFFEDEFNETAFKDLYNEKSGVLDGESDSEVDLASYAYQIWKNAVTNEPKLQKIIPNMPFVVYSAKEHQPSPNEPDGILLYMNSPEGNDALIWVDKDGKSVTESQFSILKAAQCSISTPALERTEEHHDLVKQGVELIVRENKYIGGQLGRPSGARSRTYEKLKRYENEIRGTFFESQDLVRAIDEIYKYPLYPSAIDTLNRQLKSNISDQKLSDLIISLRNDARLCIIPEEHETNEPRVICSLGLRS